MIEWTAMVCAKFCKWDHKPGLRKTYGQKTADDMYTEIPGTGKRAYYDIWSNIHYGYVGRAGGFSRQALQEAQAVRIPVVGRADPANSVAVQIGIGLYDKHGDQGISDADLDMAIRAAIPKWESFPGQGVVKRAR